MRLRNVPGAREVMIENKYVYTEPEGMSGTWAEVFGNNNPVRIEIGMGKGTFITTLAAVSGVPTAQLIFRKALTFVTMLGGASVIPMRGPWSG